MFTGLIKTTGKIVGIAPGKITIKTSLANKLRKGSSIAVEGVCLTVTKKEGSKITADLMSETLKKTTLGKRRAGDALNLELPMPQVGRLEGHIVTGHVEGTGKVTKIQKQKNSHLITIQIPKAITRYVTPKGSIAINGVSLTVIKIQKNLVTVGIIPHTWRYTNFQMLKRGDKVNIETDILAKYLEKWQK